MEHVGFALAFLAGVFSFLSPCVLPLIPAYLTFLAGSSLSELEQGNGAVRARIFFSTLFFVAGFTLVFSVLGVLLQSLLSTVAYDLRTYLSWLGGAVIIFFGLTLMGVVKLDFLLAEHKIRVQRTRFAYLTSFVFGAAFAVGWTPCVGAILGAVLTLAVTQPAAAFPLMLAYSLGLGLPFLVTGAFLSRATGVIERLAPHLKTLNVVFGLVLIVLGILVITNQLAAIANYFIPEQFLLMQ